MNDDSLYALANLRHDKDDERDRLEAVAARSIRESEEATRPRSLGWFENLSYLCGNHLTRFYYDGGRLRTHRFGIDDTSPFDDTIAQVSDNRLVRPYETVTSMLTQTRPKPRVEPASDSIEDEDSAKIASLVVDLLFENPMNMPRIRQEAAGIAMICGSAFAETEYGETDVPIEVPRLKNKKVRDNATGEKSMALVEDGTEVAFSRDIETRLWTPFHMGADPRATGLDDALWLRRSTFEDIEWLRESYGKDDDGYYAENVDCLTTGTPSNHPLYWWSRFQDVIDVPQHTWNQTGIANSWLREGQTQQAFTTLLDVRPSKQFPRGRTLVMAEGKLLYCSDQARAWSSRYPWRWHLYADFHWLKIPGRFLGVPLLSLIVPHQKRINSIDAIVRENRELMGVGQWMYAEQNRVAEGQITGISGQHIKYRAVPGVAAPQKVQHSPLPAELLIERQQMIDAIDTIAASGVLTAGLAASSMRANSMLETSREERLRSKGPMLTSFEQFIERIGQNTLIEIQLGLVREDPELTQRIRVAAKQHAGLVVNAFTGASIRDHHAVRIDVASELREAPEFKKEMALEALRVLGPQGISPSQANVLLKAMGLDEMVESEQTLSIERMRRVIARIRSGDAGPAPNLKEIPLDMEHLDERAARLGLMPGVDEPMLLAPVLRQHLLSDSFLEDAPEVKTWLLDLYQTLQAMIQRQALQIAQAQAAQAAAPQGQQEAA